MQIIYFVCFNLQGLPEGWGHDYSARVSIKNHTKDEYMCLQTLPFDCQNFLALVLFHTWSPTHLVLKLDKTNQEIFANNTHVPMLTSCIMLSTLQVVIVVRSHVRTFTQNIFITKERI